MDKEKTYKWNIVTDQEIKEVDSFEEAVIDQIQNNSPVPNNKKYVVVLPGNKAIVSGESDLVDVEFIVVEKDD